jgi:hypothetical protein
VKSSIKAALISDLVYPGAGPLYLKKYLTAAIIIIVASVALFIILSNAVAAAQFVSDKIASGEIRADVTAISEAVTQQLATESQSIANASIAIGLAWLFGIIDSFRIGMKKENN